MSPRDRILDLSDRLLFAREDAARETVRGQLHLALQSARRVERVERHAQSGGDFTSRKRV